MDRKHEKCDRMIERAKTFAPPPSLLMTRTFMKYLCELRKNGSPPLLLATTTGCGSSIAIAGVDFGSFFAKEGGHVRC